VNVKSLKQDRSPEGGGDGVADGCNVSITNMQNITDKPNMQNIKDKHDYQPATKYMTLYWIHVLPLLLNIKIYMEFQY
jgi:hypothetical protein